jgi:hypothetical protein
MNKDSFRPVSDKITFPNPHNDNLDLSNTGYEEFPGESLHIAGYLDLEGTKVKTIPDNSFIGGSLYLSGSAIESLPKDLCVGLGLYLNGTKFTREDIPECLLAGHIIFNEEE